MNKIKVKLSYGRGILNGPWVHYLYANVKNNDGERVIIYVESYAEDGYDYQEKVIAYGILKDMFIEEAYKKGFNAEMFDFIDDKYYIF